MISPLTHGAEAFHFHSASDQELTGKPGRRRRRRRSNDGGGGGIILRVRRAVLSEPRVARRGPGRCAVKHQRTCRPARGPSENSAGKIS